jgi:hypothetical protein
MPPTSSTEAMWDELRSDGFTVWGTATDDAHHYDDAAAREASGEMVFTGNRGWVMVHAERDPAAIRDALAHGEFYASSGVRLSRVEVASAKLVVEVDPASCDRPVIRFIGDHGRELASAKALEASFSLGIPGLTYVRAVVTDATGNQAWTQPVRLPNTRQPAADARSSLAFRPLPPYPVLVSTPTTIQVSYAGLLRHVVPVADETIDVPHGSNVRDLLLAIAARHGNDVREMLFVGADQLVPNAIVLLDGTDVTHLEGLNTPLSAGGITQVLVMNPATGGG